MKFDYPDDSLTLHTDAYELSMMQTYWKKGMGNRRAVFEAFFRKMPFNNGYAVFAGLDHIIRYVKQLHFTDSDIEYLKSTNQFDDDFLEYLRNFKFTGSINSFEEGDLVFNHEPIIQVDAPIIEGQLIETAILNILNYQIMIATKASRIKSIVGNQTVMELAHAGHRNWMRLCGEREQHILVASMLQVTSVQVNYLVSRFQEPMPMLLCRYT